MSKWTPERIERIIGRAVMAACESIAEDDEKLVCPVLSGGTAVEAATDEAVRLAADLADCRTELFSLDASVGAMRRDRDNANAALLAREHELADARAQMDAAGKTISTLREAASEVQRQRDAAEGAAKSARESLAQTTARLTDCQRDLANMRAEQERIVTAHRQDNENAHRQILAANEEMNRLRLVKAAH